MIREKQIEDNFIKRLCDLKYSYRPDICDRNTLEMHEYYSLPDNFINWSYQREIFINK